MEAATKGHFRLGGREFPEVKWWKEPNMRKTYICLMFVILTSVSTLRELSEIASALVQELANYAPGNQWFRW